MPPLAKPEHREQAPAWRGEIPLYSIYTLGVAGERFFRELKESGKLLGTRCTSCQLTYVPPRIYCEECFADLAESWTEVPSRGVLHTFTLAYHDLDGTRLERPVILGLIRLDGAHGGILHRLGGVAPEEVTIGMEVQMVLKPRAQRSGSITDIRHFRPVRRRRAPSVKRSR